MGKVGDGEILDFEGNRRIVTDGDGTCDEILVLAPDAVFDRYSDVFGISID
jgi:hypothetical protein